MYTDEEIKAALQEALPVVCYKTDSGLFRFGGYTEVSEDLSDSSIKKIVSSKNPMEVFEDIINTAWGDAYDDEQQEMFDQVFKHPAVAALMEKAESAGEDIDSLDERITSEIMEITYFDYPYDQYLDRLVCVDVLLDTGDGNFDFVLNRPIAGYDSDPDEEIDECSSLLWLVRQQGYSKEQLEDVLRNPPAAKKACSSKFLWTVYEEICNATSHMNAVAFFIRVPLRELIQINEAIRHGGDGYVTIGKEVCCGLYDPWNGAGSTLDICLEKDVKIPVKMIDSANVDGSRGYGVVSIYGLYEDFWEEDAVREIVLDTPPAEEKND